MITKELELNEVVINNLLEVLKLNMPDFLTAINEQWNDGVELITPLQFLPYRPNEASWEAGLPCVGVAELPTRFEDDNVSMLTSVPTLCIWVVVQEADHATLAKMLRRYTRAMMLAIQQDRVHASGSGKNEMILSRENSSVWGVKFEGSVPGDLLEERNPDAPSEPPTSYLSWTGLIVSMKRSEVG